jgi:hypothetical protein
MLNTYGFITGIERYDQDSRWNVRGPARTATSMAQWLCDRETPPAQIYLFLSMATDGYEPLVRQKLDADLNGLEVLGVNVDRRTDYETLYSFWRERLPKLPVERRIPDDSRLFGYWSGHGALDGRGRRIFFCSDYTTQKPALLFNWDDFLADLASNRYSTFSKQLFLADVCAKKAGVEVGTTDQPQRPSRNVDQVCYYATVENTFATNIGAEEGGEFSKVALRCLSKQKGWPKDDEFFADLEKQGHQLRGLLHRKTRGYEGYITTWGGEHQADDKSLAGRAHTLLRALPVSDSDYRVLYLQVVKSTAVVTLPKNATLLQMLISLSNEPGTSDEPISRLLAEFLFRIGERFSFGPNVERWCLDEGSSPNLLASTRENISRDTTQRHNTRSELHVFLRDPAVVTRLEGLRLLLDQASTQIETLTDYKELHANLHVLKEQAAMIRQLKKTFPTEETPQDLEFYTEAITQIFSEVRKVLERPTFDASTSEEFGEAMSKIEMHLRAALSTLDSISLEEGIRCLWVLLDHHLRYANSGIRQAIKALPFQPLIDCLTRVEDRAPTEFGLWLRSLQTTHAELTKLVKEHDAWQSADGRIRIFEMNLESSLVESYVAEWNSLRKAIEKACEGQHEQWARSLAFECKKLSVAIEKADIQKARVAFPSIRAYASKRFLDVDENLRRAESLKQIRSQIGIALDAL